MLRAHSRIVLLKLHFHIFSVTSCVVTVLKLIYALQHNNALSPRVVLRENKQDNREKCSVVLEHILHLMDKRSVILALLIVINRRLTFPHTGNKLCIIICVIQSNCVDFNHKCCHKPSLHHRLRFSLQ